MKDEVEWAWRNRLWPPGWSLALLWELSSWTADGSLFTVSFQAGERERKLSPSSYISSNFIIGTIPSWPHLTLVASPRLHFQIPSHRALEFWCVSFGGHIIQFVAVGSLILFILLLITVMKSMITHVLFCLSLIIFHIYILHVYEVFKFLLWCLWKVWMKNFIYVGAKISDMEK